MASALAPDAQRRIIGIRAGEKVHEVLVTEDEARHCYDLGDRYVIFPELAAWDVARPRHGERLPDGFRFASDLNDRWLSAEDLRQIVASISTSLSGAGDAVVSDPSWAARTRLP